MPNNASLHVRVDAKTKRKIEEFSKEYGLSTADGVRQLIQQGFRETDRPHIPNAETRRALRAKVMPMPEGGLEQLLAEE